MCYFKYEPALKGLNMIAWIYRTSIDEGHMGLRVPDICYVIIFL